MEAGRVFRQVSEMIALFLLFSGCFLSIVTGKRTLMLALTQSDDSHVLAYALYRQTSTGHSDLHIVLCFSRARSNLCGEEAVHLWILNSNQHNLLIFSPF